MSKDCLIKGLSGSRSDALEDHFVIVAQTVEKALLQAGAKPEQDYTILDVFKLAQPFLLEMHKKNPMSFYLE